MPPHLHPRSRMTSSLFATTVAASFLVVAVPHLLPCPAPRVTYADASTDPTSGRRRVRRRREAAAEVTDGLAQFDSPAGEDFEAVGGANKDASPRRERRECPVPKPGGVIGELMGFSKSTSAQDKSVEGTTAKQAEGPEGTRTAALSRSHGDVEGAETGTRTPVATIADRGEKGGGPRDGT
ncbi:hypothetical protein F4780DRAFT_204463 [Xylariomycetidae sp. FL0641]|nr:hypothetical protein F4780DRAFT_204463 [Xylariomycetidae sp. FL0641]